MQGLIDPIITRPYFLSTSILSIGSRVKACDLLVGRLLLLSRDALLPPSNPGSSNQPSQPGSFLQPLPPPPRVPAEPSHYSPLTSSSIGLSCKLFVEDLPLVEGCRRLLATAIGHQYRMSMAQEGQEGKDPENEMNLLLEECLCFVRNVD